VADQLASAVPRGGGGIPEALERPACRHVAVPVDAPLRVHEREPVAEAVLEVDRVRAEGGREQEQRREPRESSGRSLARPEQDEQRGQEREADDPGRDREPAQDAGGEVPPALSRKEGAGGEREEEAVATYAIG
jgi:hypothetical protein